MKFVRTTAKNIRRSPYQAVAAILIMTLTFLVVSFFSFLTFGSSQVINYFESKPQVTAFFKDDATNQDISVLKTQLDNTQKVSSIKFVSKQQALEIYKQQNKDDPLLLDLVTADVLPASFEISAVKLEDLTQISNMLKKSPIVSDVLYQKDVVSALTTWTNAIRKIGVGLIALFSLVSVFIMATIIGMKISQKKEDIEIMRLIGASNWYVRLPFITEGVFYAVFGAVIGWLIASLILLWATPFLDSFLKGIPVLPVSIVGLLTLLGLEVLFAVTLGILSSFIAVLRYLK